MELTREFVATILYGLLNIGGGILGYTKSQSKVSLISGGISGVILLTDVTQKNRKIVISTNLNKK